jgi:hypothetical protein
VAVPEESLGGCLGNDPRGWPDNNNNTHSVLSLITRPSSQRLMLRAPPKLELVVRAQCVSHTRTLGTNHCRLKRHRKKDPWLPSYPSPYHSSPLLMHSFCMQHQVI